MDHALATRHWLTQRAPATPPRPTRIGVTDARQRLDELNELFAQAPPDQRKIVEDLLASPNTNIADKLDALQHANTQQAERRDWILEHWPNVIEHHQLTTILHDAGPLDHRTQALPARAQELLDELRRTSTDTPEERTLTELDHAIRMKDPVQQIRQLEHDLKPLRQQIRRFDLEPPGDTGATLVARAHIERLRQRAQAIEAEIARAETRTTLHTWKQRSDPELAAAITRRTNHLTHHAISTDDPLVTEIAIHLTIGTTTATADDFREAIADAVAVRERGGHRKLPQDRPAPTRNNHTPPNTELPAL